MKKLVLLLTIISHFAFGQNNAPQYNSTTKKTTQYTGVVPKAPVWSATDTTSGKSSVYQFETNRIKYKNQRIETDTSKFDKVNVGKGDSAFWVSKKLISGSGAIDTLKVGRIEQGRGTAPIFMYFNGVAWVRNDTSYIPRSGASNITGNLESNQLFFKLGLNNDYNSIEFSKGFYSQIKSTDSSSNISSYVQAISSSLGSVFLGVSNPNSSYSRSMFIDGSNSSIPNQSFNFDKGLAWYTGDYRTQMTSDNTIPDIGKVKQLISDSIAGGGGGTLTSVYSANSDILVDSSITGKRKLTLNSGSGANQIVKRDGSGNIVGYAPSTSGTSILKGNGTGGTSSATSTDILGSIALNSTNILIGNGSNTPQAQALSLNATGGTFGLSNAGVLTMPDATATSKGLVTSADYKKYLASDLGGVLFTDNFTRANNASLGANYTQSGSTMSILSNKLRMTNAAGSLSWTSNSAKITGISPSNLENFEVSATATIPTLSSTTFGASIGFESTTLPTYGQSFEVRFAMETANQGKILFYNTQSLINLNKATGSLTISSGNTTAIKVVVNKNEIIATWTNTTTSKSLTQSFVFELGRTTAVKAIMANTHYVTLFSQGGTIDVDDVTITSTTKKGGIWKIGDSITMGYSAGDLSKRAVDILDRNYVGNFTAFGAGNLRIEELTSCAVMIAAHLPDEIIFSAGVNNLRFSESAATIAGRVATFLTTLNSLTGNYYVVGVNFFVESLVPQTLQSAAATNDLLASTYGTGFIDTYSSLKANTGSTPNTAYYNIDGIHPNAKGFQEQAKAIALKRGYTLKNNTDPNNYSVRAQPLNGYVGIGDVTPQTSLDVVGSRSQIRVSNTTSSATDNGLYITGVTGAGNIGYNTYYDSTQFIAKGTTTSSITFGGNALRFFADTGASIGSSVSQTQKMTITRSGVGIGITSPTAQLHVSTNGQSLNSIFAPSSVVDAILYSGTKRLVHRMVVSNDTLVVRPLINFQRTRGSNTSPTSVTNGTSLGSIAASAYDGTSIFSGTDITSIVNGTVSTGVVPCDMVFSTTATNTLTERMRINSTGNVGIGKATPSYVLDLVGTSSQLHLNNSSSDVGFYGLGLSTSAAVMYNSSFDGTNFIAKGTDASSMFYTATTLRFNINSGLTGGSSYTPSEIMRLTATGLGIGTTTINEKLEVSGNAKLNHLIGRTSTPTIAAGAGAGTTPTVSLSNATDISGLVNVTTGTLPAGTNAVIATITFNTTYGQAPNISLTPANALTAALSAAATMVYVTSTTTTFVINAGTTGLTAATAYKWYYSAIQ